MKVFLQKIQTVSACIFPTNRLAVFSLLMIAVELSVLISSPGDPLQIGGPIPAVVICWLMWFWLTLSWGIDALGKLTEQLDQNNPRHGLLVRIAFGLFASFALLLHICSWGLFKQAGQFANWEAFRFLVINPPLSIWSDLTGAEKFALITACSLVLLCVLFSSKLLRFLTQSRESELVSVRHLLLRRYAWYTATLLLVIPAWMIISEESPIRRATWYQIVKTRMHPVTTLTLSAVERFFMEPVHPVLNEDELTPLTVEWTPPPKRHKRPSVIVVAVEALRADTVHLEHQGRPILPNINRLASRGVEFTNAYSQSTHSDYADVCVVSSLYPLRTRQHHYYTKGDPWPKTLAFDVFKQVGYSTAIVSSQNEGWGNMDQFLMTPNLDLFYDAARSGLPTNVDVHDEAFEKDPGFAHELRVGSLTAGKLNDGKTMDRAIEWVQSQVAADQPFFLSMNFQSSHFPYDIPEHAERPFQPYHLDSDVKFMEYPLEKTENVRNAYYNGIHHCDFQIGRMVETLEKLQILDDVILIVLGENGEAFNENGYCGHAQEPVQPMVHVATIVHAPKRLSPAIESYPLEHVDIMPTVLGLLDWNTHPNFQGINVFSEQRIPAEERLIFLHANNCSNQADAVILGGRWKYLLDHNWQTKSLHDLQTDPSESTNVVNEYPELAEALEQKLLTWRNNQLAFYHYSNYFTRFYPPTKPAWQHFGPPQQSGGLQVITAN